MSTIFTEESVVEENEMKLYTWKLGNYDCECRYSAIAKTLEEAREIVLHDLTKAGERGCILCLFSGKSDYEHMSFDEKEEMMDRNFHTGGYVIRNWIRDTEPSIHKAGKMFRD